MKKLLLVTTALAGVALWAAPASAEVKLDLGGYFRGYGVHADNDETASMHSWDLRRNSEVHVSGETTLDNGLTVGFHTEQQLGAATVTDEAYAYFSSGLGRVNLGSEDGAAYLLQVGAPSADSNVDGLRVYVQALNPTVAVASATHSTVFTGGVAGLRRTTTIDYDHTSDNVANTERLTYLTPKFNGFQAGVSLAPTSGQQAAGTALAPLTTDNDVGQYDNIWEGSVRWDGEFQGFGLSAGGGYSQASLEAKAAAPALNAAPVVDDDLTKWNAGLSATWNGFSLGGAYLREDTSNQDNVDADGGGAGAAVNRSLDVQQDTWVVGAAWDNGPWHVGASWLDQNQTRDGDNTAVAADGGVGKVDATVTKYAVGGGYTFGPGMTFRGAVAWGEFDSDAIATDAAAADGLGGAAGVGVTAAENQKFQQITVGTDIQF